MLGGLVSGRSDARGGRDQVGRAAMKRRHVTALTRRPARKRRPWRSPVPDAHGTFGSKYENTRCDYEGGSVAAPISLTY